MGKTAVVYYSLEGNSQFTAEIIAKELDAQIIRLYPEKEPPKKGIGKFLAGGGSALFLKNYPVKPIDFSVDETDKVVIVYPVWAGTFAPAIGWFLRTYSLKEKWVAAVACSASGKAEKSFQKISALIEKENLEATLSLVNPLLTKEETKRKVREFCEKVR